MGRKSKKQIANKRNIMCRYGQISESTSSESLISETEPDNYMSIGFAQEPDNLYDFRNISYGSNKQNNGSQCEIMMKDASTQTFEYGSSNQLGAVLKYFSWNNLLDLISVFVDSVGNWSSIHHRLFSIILYVLIRFLDISFESTREILKYLNLLRIQTCHEWALTMIDEDDLCVVLRENRGSYKKIIFYDEFSDLEKEAKAFALSKGCAKNCAFDAQSLANFLNERFRELYPDNDLNDDELIRSVESCRTDLLKWRAKWEKNSNRPYFEGHEREDVVLTRKKFIQNLLDSKDFYYYPNYDGEMLIWVNPMRQKRILVSHDESIFRSGETSSYRWIFPGNAPFYNKGKGRSIMISIFMVQSDVVDLFELDEDEYMDALEAYPELDDIDDQINYYPRSANAWIEPKKDNYFDSDIIQKQFDRFFIMAKFKKAFKDHSIEIIVDNARTHTTKVYDVKMFNKFPGTNCMYNEIRWEEDGNEKVYEINDNF